MFVHRRKTRDGNSWKLDGFVLAAEFIYCRREFVPMLWPFLFLHWHIGKNMLSLKLRLWPGTEHLQQEHVVLLFSRLFLQWQALPHSQGWHDREGWLWYPRENSPGETNGEQKLYIAGYLKQSSQDFLTCSKVAPCIVFLIRSAGSHLQRKHQSHLVTKHTAVYCLVLLSRRGPGLFTAGTCDEEDNIN